MKKITVFLLIMFSFFQGCTYYTYQTPRQYKSMRNFDRKKRNKFYSIKKRTHYYHPSVKRVGKRKIMQKYREDRVTSNY